MLSCEDRAPEEALLHAFYMYWDKGEPDLTILLLSPSQLRLQHSIQETQNEPYISIQTHVLLFQI